MKTPTVSDGTTCDAPKVSEKLTSVLVFTAEEARQMVATIDELRPHWERRAPHLPFFTLGTASYLDGTQPPTGQYEAKSRRTNPLLREHFAAGYERLAQALRERLKEPVVYDEAVGLPGFHIFESHSEFTKPLARVHIDAQYNSIAWPDRGAMDFNHPVSFTLALELPAEGSGLNWWAGSDSAIPPEYHPYAVGQMAIHSGHTLHQIAPAKAHAEGARRITWQGHALRRKDGAWVVYW